MGGVKKYVKKPIEIEAIQWNGNNIDELNDFGVDVVNVDSKSGDIYIVTLEGEMLCKKFSYVIKGVDGEFYACKKEIFEKTYYEVKSNKKNE